jgi:glycosyltransferase involved in cell wall biosynthesis
VKEVGVVIPAYNAALFLPESIESVLNQTYQDFELIVVDDGSTDDTRKVLEAYRDRLSYFHRENGGISKARNMGIKSASVKYIALLDADDIWLPDKLEKQIAFFNKHPELGVVFCDLKFFDEKRTGYTTFWKDTGYLDEMTREHKKIRKPFVKLMRKNFILSSSVVVKKECFDKAGLFDESVRCPGAEDKDMWLRIAAQYDMGCVPACLVKRRTRPYPRKSLESVFISIIEVVEKMERMFPDMIRMEGIRPKAIKGQRYYFLGRLYWDDNNLILARDAFVQSLRNGFSMRALTFLVLTFPGLRWINTLRWIKNGLYKFLNVNRVSHRARW